MAQEISYSPQVEPEGIPGRAYPRVSDYVPSGAFGGEIGRGLEEAGTVAEHHFQAAQAQARQSQLTDAHNQLQQLSLSLSHDPQNGAFAKQGKDAFGLNEQYLPQYDTQAQQIIQGVKDPRARQAAQLAAAQVRNHLQEQLDSHEMQQHKEFGINTAKSSIQLAQQAASSNYNHPDIIATNLDGIDHQVDTLAGQLGMSDAQREELRYTSRAEAHRGVLTSMLSDDKVDMAKAYLEHYRGELKPQEVKEAEHAIQAGQIKQATDGIMAAYGQDTRLGEKAFTQWQASSDLPQEDKLKVAGEVRRARSELEASKLQDPKINNAVTSLEESIARGKVAPNALGSADWLWHQGALSDERHASMRGHIERIQDAQKDEEEAAKQYTDAFKSRTPLDPESKDDKKGVDALFQTLTSTSKPGSAAFANAAVDVTDRVGVIPSSAISWARANLVSGDPQSAARAADLIARLQETNKSSTTFAIDAKTKALASMVNEISRAGGDPEQAMETVRRVSQMSDEDVKRIDEKWGSDKAAKEQGKALAQSLRGDDELMRQAKTVGTTVEDLKVPPGMQTEYNDLTREYYGYTGGDVGKARDLALRDLKGAWGISKVNGAPEFMWHAPERHGIPSDVVRRDIAESVAGVRRPPENIPTPGLVKEGTISNLWDRPILKNADGTISTTLSFSIGTDKGETLIPQVINGKKLTREEAVEHYRKTGEHLGIFDTAEHADEYARALHDAQDRYIHQPKPLAASGIEASKVRLVPDPQRTARTNGVEWNLEAPDKHGFYTILHNEDGSPIVYHMPNPNAEAGAAKKTAADEGMARAHAKREDQKQPFDKLLSNPEP